MLYGPGNCDLPAHVYDGDRIELIGQVLTVDVDAGEVECRYKPLRLNHDGTEVDTFKVRFQTIYPICAGSHKPTLFHCYGRIDA